jgi:2-methylcitrate dehydratase
VAESIGVDGRRLLSGMVVAYETALRMTEATKFRQRGYDQGFSIAIGTAAGLGHMLGLTKEQIAHAVAISMVGSIPLRATRAGVLSLWKGAATAFATRNGVFAALLAAEGMTGPEKPVEGRHGLWEQITGPFEYEIFPHDGGPWKMLGVRMKFWPVEYNAQIAVWAALDLRKRMRIEDIAGIDIATYWSAWHEIGSEPAKWDPRNRETADHSMPYCFARALVDGTISLSTFDEAAYLEPSLRPLMARISIHEDDEINAAFPATVGIRVTVTDTSGNRQVIDMKNPRGHEENQMTDEEIDVKFMSLAESRLSRDGAKRALSTWRSIETARTLTAPLDGLVDATR